VILAPLAVTLLITLLVNFAPMVLTHPPSERHLVPAVGVVEKRSITLLVCSAPLDTSQKRVQVVNNVPLTLIPTPLELALVTLVKQVQK